MHLRANESTADRIIRIVVGIALAALVVTGFVSGPIAILASIAGAIAVITGIVGSCPLYAILRIGTRPAVR